MIAKPSLTHQSHDNHASAHLKASVQSENESKDAIDHKKHSNTAIWRTSLANISSKMQSSADTQPLSKLGTSRNDEDHDGDDLLFQAEFGKASPLRNPLLGNRSMHNHARPVKQASLGINRKPVRSFTPPLGGQPVPDKGKTLAAGKFFSGEDDDALEQLQKEMAKQPKTRIEIAIPSNRPTITSYPAPRPIFSSVTAHQQAPTYVSAAPLHRKVNEDSESEDEFDPNAAVRHESDKFGSVDPHMYLDSDKANHNIKNLLEGAFDDELDKPQARLKSRRTARTHNDPDANSLANKLSALSVSKSDENVDEEPLDDGTVDGLAVKLLPHQVDGVSWMIDKEAGQRKNGVLPKGGILADDMGLGKTIQSVALILLNPRPASSTDKGTLKRKLPSSKVGKSTLVVAPLALIRQWEDEIKTKVDRSHALKVLVHHGSNRTKSATELSKYDVVITTYQILTSEHAASDHDREGGVMTGCFGVHWYRVILDEAHSIKNRNAKSSLACCDLKSWHRWCLTGTPMQNNLDELQSLIKFLRIKPYCELSSWKQQIIQPIKSGRGGLAMARLHHYLNAFMKRRTKDVLKKDGALGKDSDGKTDFKIVKREVINVECSFNEQEQVFYDRLSDRATDKINAMMSEGGKDYMGALVLLLRLRQACNHPSLVEKAIDKDREAIDASQKEVQTNDMDDLAAMMGGISVKTRECDVCGSKMSERRIQSGQSRCEDCEDDLRRIKPTQLKQKRRGLLDSDDEDDDEDDQDDSGFSSSPDDASTDLRLSMKIAAQHGASTKIREIVSILRSESEEHKTIVFSQFTSMLDIIQPYIKQRFVRYDGSMKPDEREAALNALRNDKRTRVLLCSLKCGSLGLNLTAASRVIIVEPFWNPFVEEQAIDRVHRLNQTVDVKVYRLTIGGSVEERILALQEKKRELAKAAIEGGRAAGKLSMNDILGLFRSDAQTAEMHEMDRKFAEKIGYDSKLINGSQSSPAKAQCYREAGGTIHKAEHQVYGRRW